MALFTDRDRESQIADLLIDAANLGAPSAEEVRRYWHGKGVFVSSVIRGYEDERAAAITAIESRSARPVAWERIVPAPVPAEQAWLGGVNASEALVLLLGPRYGPRREDGMSATHVEFERAEDRGIPRWVLLDSRADGERDALLQRWIDDDLSQRHSYGRFDSEESLAGTIMAKLDDEAATRVFTWYKFGGAMLRAESTSLSGPDRSLGTSGSSGTFSARGTILDAGIRDYLARARQNRDRHPLVIDGQVFEARLETFIETTERGLGGYQATFELSAPTTRSGAMLDLTYSAAGRHWSADDIARAALEHVLDVTSAPSPAGLSMPSPIDWHGILQRAGGLPQLVDVLSALLVTERAVSYGIFARVQAIEARLVGPPRAISLRVRGSRPTAYRVEAPALELSVQILVH